MLKGSNKEKKKTIAKARERERECVRECGAKW